MYTIQIFPNQFAFLTMGGIFFLQLEDNHNKKFCIVHFLADLNYRVSVVNSNEIVHLLVPLQFYPLCELVHGICKIHHQQVLLFSFAFSFPIKRPWARHFPYGGRLTTKVRISNLIIILNKFNTIVCKYYHVMCEKSRYNSSILVVFM